MAANVLTYNAIGTILNQIVTQATGKAVITPTNTSEFTAVAQIGLLAGYDNLMRAISQVLSKTIISTRPYSRHFQGLEADAIRYGNHVRKINYIDRDWEDGSRLPLTTGVPVDDVLKSVKDLTQTFQNGFIMGAQQPKPITAEDILANIINPPSPKKEV